MNLRSVLSSRQHVVTMPPQLKRASYADQAESRPGAVSHQLEMSFWRFMY
jgi:hypothetical protein